MAAILLLTFHNVCSFELDDVMEAKLVDPEQSEEDVVLHLPEVTGRYSFLYTTPIAWLRSLGLVNYNNYGYYVTLPQKDYSSILLNGTTSNAFPLSYTLAGAAILAYVGAYLVSYAPSSFSARTGYDYDDLGGKLNRDAYDEFRGYEDDEDFDYQYPDSLNTYNDYEDSPKGKLSKRRKKDRVGGRRYSHGIDEGHRSRYSQGSDEGFRSRYSQGTGGRSSSQQNKRRRSPSQHGPPSL